MSDKKPFKVDLATVTLIFVLIVAFIIILFCLISKFYNKMQIAKEKVKTLNDKIEIIANEKEPVVIETLDIYSDEMFDLYGMIEMVSFSTEIENFHREGKITVDDFTNEEKLIKKVIETVLKEEDIIQELEIYVTLTNNEFVMPKSGVIVVAEFNKKVNPTPMPECPWP